MLVVARIFAPFPCCGEAPPRALWGAAVLPAVLSTAKVTAWQLGPEVLVQKPEQPMIQIYSVFGAHRIRGGPRVTASFQIILKTARFNPVPSSQGPAPYTLLADTEYPVGPGPVRWTLRNDTGIRAVGSSMQSIPLIPLNTPAASSYWNGSVLRYMFCFIHAAFTQFLAVRSAIAIDAKAKR
ncbi:hypothetical protein B0H13DRAFT_1859335 [Mycena leptocephala]|nr:hypothetical protein B0H13DRAFT_1859335 [Mycena leptocephala]